MRLFSSALKWSKNIDKDVVVFARIFCVVQFFSASQSGIYFSANIQLLLSKWKKLLNRLIQILCLSRGTHSLGKISAAYSNNCVFFGANANVKFSLKLHLFAIWTMPMRIFAWIKKFPDGIPILSFLLIKRKLGQRERRCSYQLFMNL